MQELYALWTSALQPADLAKSASIIAPLSYPSHELLQGTATSRSTFASRQRHDAVIHIDPDKVLVLRWRAVQVVWISEFGSIPTDLLRWTCKTLEDDSAAHWDDVGRPECTVLQHVTGGQVGRLRQQVERRHERRDVAIMDEAEKQRACFLWAFL